MFGLHEMTVMITYCSGERSFSQTNIIQNQLRTTDQLINNLHRKWYL